MKNSTALLFVAAGTILSGVLALTVQAADTADSTKPNSTLRGGRGPALPPELMSIYDVDANDVLDADERAVLHEHVASGEVTLPRGPGRGRGPGRRGGPAGGRGMGPPAEIVAQYDTDKDGTLSATERAALRADVEAGKIELPRRGPGRRGPGRDVPPSPAVDSTNE